MVIDERLGLLDRFNLGDPWPMYQRRDADAVGDDLTFDHFFRGTVSHREPQIGRGNLIEIARSEKTPKFLGARSGKLAFAIKREPSCA